MANNFRGIAIDPVRNFKFRVTIEGYLASTGFTSVSGLKDTTEAVDYREGTDPARPRKLPGQTTYDNVILARGLTTNADLLNWREQVKVASLGKGLSNEGLGDASSIRKTVTISLGDYFMENSGTPAFGWILDAAWPISLEASEFSGDGNDVVIETMELAHEGLSRTVVR